MSLEVFQLLNNEPFDNSIFKKVYLKVYQKQGAQLNQSDQYIEFFVSENNNYHRIGNGYLEFDITACKSDSTNFHYDDPIRLVNNGFAFCFKEARLSALLGSDIEINKPCCQVSTIMRVISNKGGDLLSQFEHFNENDIPVLERLAELPPQTRSAPHQKMLQNNHTDANKGKVKGYLYLEDIFVFCRIFKKVPKHLGFHLMLKTADLPDILYTSMTDNINVTIKNLYLFLPNLIPSVETQLLFNEATQNDYTIPYDDKFTERRVISDFLVQHDKGSNQKVNSSKYLTSAHQTKNRILTLNKNNIITIVDNLDLRNYYVELEGQRYPRDGISINYTENDYIDQYRDLKLYFEEYIGEPILKSFISNMDVKTKYSIGITDLRHHFDHITSKRIQLFQEYDLDPDNARLFLILFKRRENELGSDGNKFIEVTVIKKINT